MESIKTFRDIFSDLGEEGETEETQGSKTRARRAGANKTVALIFGLEIPG